MDIKNKTEYEFLNLSGLDESCKNEINTILKSHVASDLLKLPWDIGENNTEYNVEHLEVLEPQKEWQPYDTTVDPMKYNSIPATQNFVFPSIVSNTYPSHSYMTQINDFGTTYYMQNVVPGDFSNPYYLNGQMPQIMRENRRGRGRGNKRGSTMNDNFNSRNHNINMNHNTGPNEVIPSYISMDLFTPVMPSNNVYQILNLNGMQQHPVAGYSLMYGTTVHHQAQSVHSNIRTYSNNSKYKYPNINPMIQTTNSEGGYSMHQMRNDGPMKDRQEKHFYQHHRGQNNRGRSTYRQVEEDSTNTSPPNSAQTNIITTTTKVIVKNSPVEETTNGETKDVTSPKKSTSTSKKVKFKIEQTFVSTINSNNSDTNFNNDNKSELSTVNINSSIEVKQDNEEKEKGVDKNSTSNQQKLEIESEEATEVTSTENKIEDNFDTEKPIIQSKKKDDNKLIPGSQKQTISVEESTGSHNTPPPPPPKPIITAPTQTKLSFATMLKKNHAKGGFNLPTVKPTARINPLSVNNNSTANNIELSETEKEKIKTNVNSSAANNGNIKNKSALKNEHNSSENSVIHNINTNVGSMQTQNYCNDPHTYRMGEFLINYQMDKQTVSLQPRGLTNHNNHCYINSILQALLACPPFYNLLMAIPYLENTSKKGSVFPLLDNMIRFVREFSPVSDGTRFLNRKDRLQKHNVNTPVDIQDNKPFEPNYVYTMLKNTSSVFSVEGRQEDAEEFLSCLLNGISDEMLQLMKIASSNKNTTEQEASVNYIQGEEEWKVMGPKNKGSITRCTEFGRTPLSDIFRGQLRSRVIRSGEQSTDNVQPFFTLQLDIEKAKSVTEAFEILVGKDPVEGMTCSKTKQQIEAWKQVFLEELPVVLILHLKWFDYKLNGCSKILKQVEFPVNLKIDNKFLSPNTMRKYHGNQKHYKLFAVTYHDGNEATKGHYLTDAFNVGYGIWIRYDDNTLEIISESKVLKSALPRVPYLLYYRRQDTIGTNNNINTNINQSNNVRSR